MKVAQCIKLSITGCVALFVSSTTFGQSGDFVTGGKVVNSSGQPIVGATITYTSVDRRLSFDMSRADGTFGSTATEIVQPKKDHLTMAAAGSVTLDIFDMTGKKVATVTNKHVDKGVYSLEPIRSKLAKTMYVVKITAGNEVRYQKLLNTGNSLHSAVSYALSSENAELVLANQLAAVDTVRIGKTGYNPKYVAITSLTSNIGNQTLTDNDIEAKVNAMFGQLSDGEVRGQCAMPSSSVSANDAANARVGSSFGGGGAFSGYTPSSCANWCDGMQNASVGTPRKIPLLIAYDGVHGMDVMKGGTILPHNMGIGAIQDSNLVQKTFRVAGLEIRGTGANWTFGPCIAVIRDDRWGRAYEGFAETAALTEKMARWAVLGLQTSDLSHPWAIAATVKHFAGDGGTINGVNPGKTSGTDSEARALHLPGYTAAIKAGAATVMPSFSQWTDGTYMHANKTLLTDWLKTQQGFSGFVVGDWNAHDAAGGISNSMNAGLDVPMAPGAGTVVGSIPSNARTQDACKRVLRIKYRMNLFNQYITDRRLTSLVGCAAHRDVARAAVRASLVLLKSGNSALPIPKSANVAVWGQGGNDIGIQCGGWTVDWQGSPGNITPGTTIYQGVQDICTGSETYSSNASNAGNADYIIAVLSENPYAEKSYGGIGLTGDAATGTNSAVIGALANAKSQGKKVIVILMAGRPLDIGSVINNCDAFIWASLPGTEGKGVAEVLFNENDAHFTGKLPISWPNTSATPANGGARYAAGTGITPF